MKALAHENVIIIITFSKFDEHSSTLLKQLNFAKIFDLVTFKISTFMYKYNNNLLPCVFQLFLLQLTKYMDIAQKQQQKKSFYLPKARTNYGKFIIRFQGPKI